MEKPKCYFASPLGFAEETRGWYKELLKEAAEFVVPIDPFKIMQEQFLPMVEASKDLKEEQHAWCEAAEELYRQIRDEADMMVSNLTGAQPDDGMASETGYAFALNHTGFKKLPIIVYRNDLRSAGDGRIGYNSMFLPAWMKTEHGREVSGPRAELVVAIGQVATLISRQ